MVIFLAGVNALSSLQYLDTVGWMTRRASGCQNLCPILQKVFFSEQLEEENQRSTGETSFTWKMAVERVFVECATVRFVHNVTAAI